MRLRWAGLVASWVRRKVGWENLRERDHLQYLGMVGGIILRWIFKK